MKSGISHFIGLVVSFLLVLLWVPPMVRAGDIDSAKQQLEKVKGDLSNGSWDSIEKDIKATEDFLDGVPAADKDPVQKELDGLKVKAAAGVKEYQSKRIIESAKSNLDSIAGEIANSPVDVTERIDGVIEKLKSDDAKKYVDADALAKLQKRADSLRTMSMKKSSGQKFERANIIMKELDDQMSKDPFKGVNAQDLDHVVQDLNSLMSRIRGAIEGVPADDPQAKAINDKLAGYQKRIDAAVGGAMAGQVAENLARRWKNQQEYFDGWDKELAGPKWNDYRHRQSEEMSNLLMPKTVELMRRLGPFFEDSDVKSAAEQYKDSAPVKATLADAHKTFDTAAAKLNTAFNNLLAEAEGAPTPNPNDIVVRDIPDNLAHEADMWLKGTAYHDATVARAKKLGEKWKGAIEGEAMAKQALLVKMTNDAEAAWPGIAAKYKAEDGFTPDKVDAYKGKIIHIKSNNRLGWDYMPGSYNFEHEINGMPVAGRFDPAVSTKFDEVAHATGGGIPDEGWDVYGVVEGQGKIDKREQRSAKITSTGGQDVGTVTGEVHSTVPCAIIRIIAVHAGPLAIGTTVAGGATAAAGSSGSSGGAVGSTGSSGVGFLMHFWYFIEFLVCAAAAGLIVLKGKPALAGQMGGAGAQVASMTGGENISIIGLVLAVIGVLWLLGGLIIRDLLPALSLTAAGLYLAADWLNARKILPASVTNPLKPFGMPIAGAAALFGFLHIFLGHLILF